MRKMGNAPSWGAFPHAEYAGTVKPADVSPAEPVDYEGIFNSNKPIDVSVNLLKDQLGTIASEFLKTGKGEREFNLLPKVQSNEAPILAVIPFMNNGQYGGAEITSLDIEYVCQTGKECTVAPCAASKMVSECIKEEFGEEAYKDLLKRHPEWVKK